MACLVDEGTSSYTVGDTAGRGFVGHEVLRRSGVASLVVLPLSAAGGYGLRRRWVIGLVESRSATALLDHNRHGRVGASVGVRRNRA